MSRLSHRCIQALAAHPSPFKAYRTVLAYRRWSSRKQRGNSSSGRQGDAAEQFAAEHGLALSPLSCTDDGVSGFSGKNVEAGALGQLLAAVADGAVPTPALLLIEAQDRFGRRPPLETLQRIFGQCLGAGLDLYLLDRGLHVTAAAVNTDVSVLIRLVLEIDAAHGFSDRLSRRMLHAHQAGREKIAAGRVARIGWSPEWIDAIDNTGAVIPRDAGKETKQQAVGWRLNSKAETVLRIVELAEQGMGQVAIAKQLNAHQIRPFRFDQSLAAAVAKAQRRAALEGLAFNPGEIPAPAWNPGQVAHVLESAAVAGGRELQRRSGRIAWDYWPAVIPRPRWEALRERLNARSSHQTAGRQGTVKFIGQGCCTCASCGRPVGYRQSAYRPRGHGSRAAPVVMEYMRCRGRIGGNCSAPSLPLQGVVAHILTRLRPEQIGELFPAHSDDAAAGVRLEITQLQQQREQAAAMAAAAERELARALASEPVLAPVLARQVVAAEREAQALDGQLLAAQHRLTALQGEQAAEEIAGLAVQARELLQLFARKRDQPEDRQRVNALLRRLDVRILVDSSAEQIGMAAGSGALDWRPLAAAGRQAALMMGEPNPLAAIDRDGVGAVLLDGGRETGAPGLNSERGAATLVVAGDVTAEEMLELMAEAIKQADQE